METIPSVSIHYGTHHKATFASSKCAPLLLRLCIDTSTDSVSSFLFIRKSDLYLVALLWKMTCILGDPCLQITVPMRQSHVLPVSIDTTIDSVSRFLSIHSVSIDYGTHYNVTFRSCKCAFMCCQCLSTRL